MTSDALQAANLQGVSLYTPRGAACGASFRLRALSQNHECAVVFSALLYHSGARLTAEGFPPPEILQTVPRYDALDGSPAVFSEIRPPCKITCCFLPLFRGTLFVGSELMHLGGAEI